MGYLSVSGDVWSSELGWKTRNAFDFSAYFTWARRSRLREI